MVAALILISLAVLSRVLPTMDLSLSNFSPFIAIAFCSSVYFRKPWLWVVSFLALEASDIYLNYFHSREFGFYWSLGGFIARASCFGAALLLGTWIGKRKSWLWLLNGSLIGALLFYFVTNTQSWFTDPFYGKTLAGWWQAMTVGHPEYPPTILFFKNTLFGDLLFTGLFGGVMEWMAQRKGEPSLLDDGDEVETEESESEPEPVEAESGK